MPPAVHNGAVHEAVHEAAREAVREAVHEVVHEVHVADRVVGLVVRVVGRPDAVPDAGAGDLVERMQDSREVLALQEVPEAVLAEDLRDPAAVLPGLVTFLMFCERSGYSCTHGSITDIPRYVHETWTTSFIYFAFLFS